MEEKEMHEKKEQQPATRKAHLSLTVEERILFAVVLILLGCIILIHTMNTADFTPVVQYAEPSAGTTSSNNSSPPVLSQSAAVQSNAAAPSAPAEATSATSPVVSASASRQTSTAVASTSSAPSAAVGAVNINTASKEQLMTLKGIGEVKAQAILDYRAQNGPFRSAEELLNVKGIGEKTLENIRAQITIE